VFVLDMGEPVRILDLAEKMIRLSGKEPGRDVRIEFVGPKPGEKLHEVLVGDAETVSPTSHEAILLLSRHPVVPAWLEGELDELQRLVDEGDTLEVSAALSRMVTRPARVDAVAPARASTV
jgi:FlaA1/EpsC-like NDP-sugar epimerase